ncbi:hypothetical protein NDU88_005678 [Pleurodeles waltl]|uniref:Uncharacterized protein n=1 Tax=Pleurodeles waltl TaxID=8319 RepID=A0AAV7N189_PLEWA|nr:hypothetical protein NDU88_005678 [Pleurodeles waltl]
MTEADPTDLLRDIPLPELSVEERNGLDAELSEEEVTEALRELQLGKAAGPNGLPIELFKCVGSRVVKHMLAMFREAREVGVLQLDQRTAPIVLICKKGKPLEMWFKKDLMLRLHEFCFWLPTVDGSDSVVEFDCSEVEIYCYDR